MSCSTTRVMLLGKAVGIAPCVSQTHTEMTAYDSSDLFLVLLSTFPENFFKIHP